jgi:hypothetical protein
MLGIRLTMEKKVTQAWTWTVLELTVHNICSPHLGDRSQG